VLLILASALDVEAQRLAKHWAADDARVLTSADLSQPGWRWIPGVTSDNTFAIAGERLPVQAIAGVLTRLDTVAVDELAAVHPEDRPYVAAEMHAFLVAWLAHLTCRVLNRPTPRCLSGPHWSSETWLRLAVRTGSPVASIHRRITPGMAPEASLPEVAAEVVVVGERTFGESDASLRASAVRLARGADVHLLAVGFDSAGRVARSELRPTLDAPELVAALRDDFSRRAC
jgi:hypothetical protein